MHFRPMAFALATVAVLTAAACQDKKTRVPFVTPFTPTTVVTGTAPIFYLVSGREGQGISVSFEYSTDRGLTWKPASAAAGQPMNAVILALPAGANGTF